MVQQQIYAIGIRKVCTGICSRLFLSTNVLQSVALVLKKNDEVTQQQNTTLQHSKYTTPYHINNNTQQKQHSNNNTAIAVTQQYQQHKNIAKPIQIHEYKNTTS